MAMRTEEELKWAIAQMGHILFAIQDCGDELKEHMACVMIEALKWAAGEDNSFATMLRDCEQIRKSYEKPNTTNSTTTSVSN